MDKIQNRKKQKQAAPRPQRGSLPLRALALAGALFFCGALSPVWAAEDVPPFAEAVTPLELVINDHHYSAAEMDTAPVLRNNRVYVPLRLVSEALGYEVRWQAQARVIDIAGAGSSSEPGPEFPPADPGAALRIFVDGAELALDTFTGSPYISADGYTMVPLRVVSEALSCEVEWHNGLVIVEEKTPPQEVLKETTEEEWQALGESELSPAPGTAEETSPGDEANTPEAEGYLALTIQGKSLLTAEELEAYLADKEDDVRAMMERRYPELGFQPFPRDIARLYIEIGARYNIRGDLAFAQALKETGYFQFYGSVQPFQNNFCGLGASGQVNTGDEPLNGVDPLRVYSIPGLHGLTYLTVADGVEAHIQHLYAYTTRSELPDGCELLDPRFNYVKRGAARRWIDLDGRWAVPGDGYGESIIRDYWLPGVPDGADVLARDQG